MKYYLSSYLNKVHMLASQYFSNPIMFIPSFEKEILSELHYLKHNEEKKEECISRIIRREKIRQSINFCAENQIPYSFMVKLINHIEDELLTNDSTVIWYRDSLFSDFVDKKEVVLIKRGNIVSALKTDDCMKRSPEEKLQCDSIFLNQL